MDRIKRFISEEGLRLSVTDMTHTIEESRYRHNTWPVVTAALGRTMIGSILMAGDYKNKEVVSILIDGNGPIGKIHSDALGSNRVRGYVDNPHVDLPIRKDSKLDVGQAVGSEGTLSVTRFTEMKHNYTSQSPLLSGEIGEDLAYYMATSEQVLSTLSVGVLINPDGTVQSGGGFLIQALPNAQDEAITQVEENLKTVGPISNYINSHNGIEHLEDVLFKGLHFKKVYEDTVSFGCTCSKERFLQIVSRLKEDDKEDLLQDESIESTCHYCNSTYTFTKEELTEAFKKEEENRREQ